MVPANIYEQCGEYYLDTKPILELETMVDERKENKAEVFIVNYNKTLPEDRKIKSGLERLALGFSQKIRYLVIRHISSKSPAG